MSKEDKDLESKNPFLKKEVSLTDITELYYQHVALPIKHLEDTGKHKSIIGQLKETQEIYKNFAEVLGIPVPTQELQDALVFDWDLNQTEEDLLKLEVKQGVYLFFVLQTLFKGILMFSNRAMQTGLKLYIQKELFSQKRVELRNGKEQDMPEEEKETIH